MDDGYRFALNVLSEETGFDIIYFEFSEYLTRNTKKVRCINCREYMDLDLSLESNSICDNCDMKHHWPEYEKYLYPSMDDGNEQPIGDQFQPKFNHDGSKIAFIERDEGNYSLKVFTIPTDDEEYTEIGKKSKKMSNYYQEIDDNILTVATMDMPHWTGTDFCWHPKKDILFYVKIKEVDQSQEYKVKYYDFNTDQHYYLETGTLEARRPTISNNGEYLLFSNQGKKNRGDDHFHNCSRKGGNNEQCCFKGRTFRCCAAKLQY